MNRTALLAATIVVIAGIALFVLYTKRFSVEAAGGDRIDVLRATADIEVGEPITIEELGTRSLPQAHIEDRHILSTDRERILGVRVLNRINSDESLFWTDLSTNAGSRRDLSALLRRGMRAMTIRVSDAASFGGLLRPGNRVDILLTGNRPRSVSRVTVPLLQNVLVLAVGLDTGAPDEAEDESSDRAVTRGVDVSVAVTIEQATMITHGRDRGDLSLLLRNGDDMQIIQDVPETNDEDLIEPLKLAMAQRSRPRAFMIEEIRGNR